MDINIHIIIHKGDINMDSKGKEDVELHIRISKDIIDELSKRAEEKRLSRTELIEDSLREHLSRIKTLENKITVKEQKIEELEDEIAPSKEMIKSLIKDLLQQNQTISMGWEYERVANFFIRALNRYKRIYCPIEAWKMIKEALPPNRRNPLSQLSDYDKLCKILHPDDHYYFERCLQNNQDIYLVTK